MIELKGPPDIRLDLGKFWVKGVDGDVQGLRNDGRRNNQTQSSPGTQKISTEFGGYIAEWNSVSADGKIFSTGVVLIEPQIIGHMNGD